MASFKGILNEHSTKYSIIVSEDERMASCGMGAYNKKSFNKVLTDKESQKEFYRLLVDPCTFNALDEDEDEGAAEEAVKQLIDALTGNVKQNHTTDEEGDHVENTNCTGYGFYYKFNNETFKYETECINDNKIPDIMEYWDKAQRDQSHYATDEDLRVLTKEVRNSLDGCISFYPNVEGVGEPYKISKVYLRTAKQASSSREMVIKGDPKIAAIPRRPTGGKFDFARTKQIQKKGINEADDTNKQYGHIGRYRNPTNSQEVPDQEVAAKLRLSYNQALGYYESGTQSMIVRLLSDLPAPTLKNVDIERIDEYKFDQMYDKENGTAYFSDFTTCLAMPCSVHNGNPHTFGPNVIGELDKYKKERIRVVNRANASFNIGDIVMCSLIDNEWIVQGFGGSPAALEEVKFTVGKWSFIKMIANSDAYFRDDRWFTDDPASNDNKYNVYYRQETFGTDLREQYYYDLNLYKTEATYLDLKDVGNASINYIPLVCKLNSLVIHTIEELLTDDMSGGTAIIDSLETVKNPDITPSRRYVQSTIFDQLGTHMGGNNTLGNVVGRTNRRVNPDISNTFGEDIADSNTQMPLFWGPVFPDGYNASQVRRLLTTVFTSVSSGDSSFFGPSQELDINSSKDENNCLIDPKLYMFANARDFAFTQLPAEVGLNASPSGGFGYPIEGISYLAKVESESNDLTDIYRTYLHDDKRLSWLVRGDDDSSAFDIRPNTSTSLDFIPLTFAMCGNADNASKYKGYGDAYNTFDMSRSALREAFKDTEHLWGNMFSREAQYTSHDFVARTGIDGPSNTENVEGKNLPWDMYIKRPASNGPDGTPYGYNNGQRGANTVGIVAAKNTFGIQQGGTITFESDYAIGVNGKSGSTLSTNRWEGFGGGMNDLGGGISYDIEQWGTRDCRPIAMGHSSLYVKIFDHWPSKDTIYDARYYTPLFFCAGKFNSGPKYREVSGLDDEGNTILPDDQEWIPSLPTSGYASSDLAALQYARDIDVIEPEINVDFRVPTLGHPLNAEVDNQIVSYGFFVDKHGVLQTKGYESGDERAEGRNALRPKSEWRVNTVCRGMMVSSEGGFKHYRRTIGIDGLGDVFTVSNEDSDGNRFLGNGSPVPQAGTEFQANDEIVVDAEKSIKVKILTVGNGGTISTFEFMDVGKDLTHEDFSRTHQYTINEDTENEEEKTAYGYLLTVRSEFGTDASIFMPYGIVYDRITETDYPKQHGSMISLTPTSQQGTNGPIVDRKVSAITINEASSDNLYDAFYYAVNDVTHVDMFDSFGRGAFSFRRRDGEDWNKNYYVDQSQALQQYISLNISAT